MIGEAVGAIGDLKGVFSTGVRAVRTRLELLALEVKEEKAAAAGSKQPGGEKTTHVKSLEEELRQKLATPIEIRLRGKDRGQIILSFESNDDFMRLLEALRR